MSDCPYITLDIVPLMENQNSDYIDKYSEMISNLECNPNPYLKCGVGVMQYMKMYKKNVLTSGCMYYMDVLSYIVDEVYNSKSFREIANNVIKWAVCFIIDEVRKVLIYLLQKIVNNSILSRYARVFYNPDAPYGFYIVVYPIFMTNYRSKLYKKLYGVYFKLIRYRMTRRRWRIFTPIDDALGSLQQTLVRAADNAVSRVTDSIIMAGDRAIDKAVKRYLGKVVKYDITGQYTNETPYSPYDRFTEGTIMLPNSETNLEITKDFYYGLYSPSLFFSYSESAFSSVVESTLIENAKKVLDTIKSIGSTITGKKTDVQPENNITKSKLKSRIKNKKKKILSRKNLLNRITKSGKKPAVLIFSSLSDMYSYYSMVRMEYFSESSEENGETVYNIDKENVSIIEKRYKSVVSKSYFLKKDESNYVIDKSSDLFNNSLSLLIYANSTYYFSDDFTFMSFNDKLSMHNPDLETEYLTPYYAVRMPVFKMMAWHVNDLSSEPSDDVYSVYMPHMLGLYLFNISNTDRGEYGISYEDFVNYVDSTIITSAKNLKDAVDLINKPVIEWYYDYLRYKTESKESNLNITLKQIHNTIEHLSVNKPAYLAPVKHYVDDFLERYDKISKITDESERNSSALEAVEKGFDLMRLLNMIMLPVEGKVKDGLTQLIDWQVHSENIIFEEKVDKDKVKSSIHIGHRAAERQLMIDKMKSSVLFKLLNPALAFIIQSKEILYNYFTHVDIGTSTYAMVSLEPFSSYFDPLPARFTYDLFADSQMVNFLKRRGFDVFDPEDLNNLYYHSSISVFTDLLPVKTLSVTYDDIETEFIEYGGYKIEIPIRWNIYTPEIRLEIYDNAYRDLYNYFLKYMKIAFYKGAARPPLDISFILDIITVNLDHSVQNILSYVVVPRSIDMEYIEYDSSDSYGESKNINITFSVIGFIHYTDTIITTENYDKNTTGISFLAGSFLEKDIDLVKLDPVSKIYEYADTVIQNWYGIYNAQPLYVLSNENKITSISKFNQFSDFKDMTMKGKNYNYYLGNLYNMSNKHNAVYTLNNSYMLPSSHVYFKKKS